MRARAQPLRPRCAARCAPLEESIDAAAHERRQEQHEKQRRTLCEFLRALAREPGGLRVFVHLYSGAFDGEVVRSGGPIHLSETQLTVATALAEDRLIEIISS